MMHHTIFCADATPNLLGVFDTTIAPPFLYYSYIPLALIAILLGIVILRSKSEFPIKNKLFFIITFLFLVHIANEIVQWIGVPAGLIYFAWSSTLLLRALITTAAAYFVYVTVKNTDAPLNLKLLFVVILLPIVLLLPTSLNVQSFDLNLCRGIDGPLWRYLDVYQAVLIGTLFTWSATKLVSYLRRKEQKLLSDAYLMFGTSLFLIIFFGSELLSDITSVYDINLLSPVGMLVFIVSISYMIARFKTFNLKVVGSQFLVFGIIALIGSQLFFIDNRTNQVLVILTLLLSVLGGISLIRSVLGEIKQREKIESLAKDLARANNRLRELDKQKSEFVSIASHQLRSPLTTIRGYASMLAEGSFGAMSAKATETASRIEEAAKLMAMSIEDYLNISRIEAGNMKYILSDFNLKEMVDNICDDIRGEAMKRGLVVLFRSDIKSRALVHADIGKTTQIIHNLINNSIKYTPQGSISVLVRDDVDKKRIFVDITDTGIGMSEATISKLFNKFTRADNANTVNVSGTGLGLFVASKMAEAMGGKISAYSEGDGKGSTFTFELPLAM